MRRRAVLAVDGLREDARERGLAGAARACEEVCLADFVLLDRIREGPHDRFLPDDLLEGLRAVLAVEGGHRRRLSQIAVRPTEPRRRGRGERSLRGPAQGRSSARMSENIRLCTTR